MSWYLTGSLLHTNESVREASSCRLHAGAAGVHNVSAIASNANGSDMQTWIWNVTKAVELVITGKWLCVPDNCTICYNVTNIGNGTAHALTNIWRCGDVNCDGEVTMSDVRKVFNRYLDPGYELNCCCGVL